MVWTPAPIPRESDRTRSGNTHRPGNRTPARRAARAWPGYAGPGPRPGRCARPRLVPKSRARTRRGWRTARAGCLLSDHDFHAGHVRADAATKGQASARIIPQEIEVGGQPDDRHRRAPQAGGESRVAEVHDCQIRLPATGRRPRISSHESAGSTGTSASGRTPNARQTPVRRASRRWPRAKSTDTGPKRDRSLMTVPSFPPRPLFALGQAPEPAAARDGRKRRAEPRAT